MGAIYEEIDDATWAKMTLRQKVERIPGPEGFVKGGEAFHAAAEILRRNQGWPDDEIWDFLRQLYWDAAGEFCAG